MGFWLGFGQMVWVWLWLVMLDMMVSESWRVLSKVSGRLCGNLGFESIVGRVVECQPSIVCPL
jgi:hypothetical protein